jgi:hypothetical protein
MAFGFALEQKEHQRRAAAAGILNQVEGRPAIRPHAAEFAVEISGARRE